MSHDPKAVANAFLEIANAREKPVSPMKLLKLVYFAHGWHLGLADGAPLINEVVEAWQYGPVISSVYHEFKQYGSSPITGYATEVAWEAPDDDLSILRIEMEPDARAAAIIQKVWEIYGRLSAVQLSNITHAPGTPWHTVWHQQRINLKKSIPIPDNIIKEYFMDLARRNRGEQNAAREGA